MRDRLAALQELEFQLQRVRDSMSRPSGLYVVEGRDGDNRAYHIRHGRVVQEAHTDDHEALQALQSAAGRSDPAPLGISPHHLDEVLMIEQWFRTRPGEAGRFSIR